MSNTDTLESLIGGKAPVHPQARYLPNRGKGMEAGTKLARDLFLNGNGDGKPITNTAALAAKAGVSIGTIEKWRPVWERERGESARQAISGNGKLGGLVTAERIERHQKHVELLKGELEKLAALLPKLQVGTDTHRETLKLYASTLKQWAEESGVTGHQDAQATYNKEILKLAAREQGKSANGESERNVTPGFSFAVVPAAPVKPE